MGKGRMTAMAAAVSLAGTGALAEDVYPAAQSTERKYPFAEEMAIIADTRDRALATCEANQQARLDQLRTVIDSGTIIDREGLIAIMEDMGAPEGGVDHNADRDLIRGAISMARTNAAICDREAYQASTESLRSLQQVLEDNMAALRAETASLNDLLTMLNVLQEYAEGNAPLLQEISALREEALRLGQQADVRAETADTNAASADAYSERADEFARRVEAIFQQLEDRV